MSNTLLGTPSTSTATTTDQTTVLADNSQSPIDIGAQLPSFSEMLPSQLQPYWRLVQDYPLAEACIIFAVFWGLAYVIRRYAIQFIQKLTEKTSTDLDDEIIERLRAPIFSIVIWSGLIIATSSAGFNQGSAQYINPVALSMILLSLLRASLSVSGMVITALSRDESRFNSFDIQTEPLMVIASKILLLLIGAYVVLLVWGINPVGLLASAGIVGIAVGFAAKDTLANLFSGIFILADRPYKLGDYVNLPSGERGKITHIGIRSTRMLTRDDIEVTVPNGVIGNEKIVNESGGAHQKMRIRLAVQCSYDADLEHVCKVLMEVAEAETKLCQFPAPRVRVRGFADHGVKLQLMGWINKPEERGRVSHSAYIAIHRAFRENGIDIPYPVRVNYDGDKPTASS